MNHLDLDIPNFAPLALRRSDIVADAENLVGLEYSDKNTFAQWDENGQAQGKCNCYGLLFLIAERRGLIERRVFWPRFHRAVARFGTAATLRAYLGAQISPVAAETRQAGDVLLFRWRGVFDDEEDAMRRGRHHVAIDVGGGFVVHAVDTTADLRGGVYRSLLSAHDWGQLHSVGTLPHYSREVSSNG